MNNSMMNVLIYCIIMQTCLHFFVFVFASAQDELTIDESGQSQGNKEISATDSDYLNLYVGPTTLSSISGQVGVFAKSNIKQGDVVCEYRGPIVKKYIAKEMRLDNNYTWEMVDPDGDLAYILGENVCAYINDCVNILDNPLVRERYFLDQWKENMTNARSNQAGGAPWQMPDPIKCPAGSEMNLASLMVGHKVLLVASKDIQSNEELFYYYGNSYWLPRCQSLRDNNHMDICEGCRKWERMPDSPM